MARLEDVPLDALHDALENVSRKKPTQRLMVAILYKQGPSVPMIAEWFDMREPTIYRWFDRIEDEPIESAIRDAPRPGRPPKLEGDDRAAFEAALRESPDEYGYDASEWTAELARQFIHEEFDTEYTLRHVHRLMEATQR